MTERAATRGARWYPLVAGAIVGAVALAAITPLPVGVFWDDGVYLIGAKSLATGAGYRFLHLPGAPPAVHFPPAWPAVLALVWKLGPAFPDNVVAAQAREPAAARRGRGARVPLRRAPARPAAARRRRDGRGVRGRAAGDGDRGHALLRAALPRRRSSSRSRSPIARSTAAAGAARSQPDVAAGAARARAQSPGSPSLPALVVALLARAPAAARPRPRLAGAAALLAPWQLWIATHARELAAPFRGSYGPYLDWVLDLYRDRGAAFALVIARANLLAVMRSLGITLFPFGPRDVRPLLVTLVLVVIAIAVIRARRRAAHRAPVRALLLRAGLRVALRSRTGSCGRSGRCSGCCSRAEPSSAGASARAPARCASVRATGAFACAVGVFAIAGHAALLDARRLAALVGHRRARQRRRARCRSRSGSTRTPSPGDVVAVDGEPFIYLYTGRTVVPVHILSPDEYFAGTPIERAAADLRALIAAGRPRYAVFSGAAGERDVAPLLDGRNGTPKLEWLAALPGGGAAYRVVLPP